MPQVRSSFLINVVSLALVALLLLSVHKWMGKRTKDIQRIPIVGATHTTSTAQSIASATKLPLIAYKPTDDVSSLSRTVTDDIFVSVPKAQEPVVVPNVKTDYVKMLTQKLTVQSVSSYGAVINGIYVSSGDDIPGVEIQFDDGKVAQAVLVKADPSNDVVTVKASTVEAVL